MNAKYFRYKPSLDIITTLIWGIVALAGFVGMSVVMTFILPAYLNILHVIYAIIAVIIILVRFLEIYSYTFRRLSISTNEIIYNTGWLTKHTTSIPANKIRSCSKSSGVLQRACQTMDISVTTSGDSEEICFCNIENGEEAYALLSHLAQNAGNER